MDTSLILYLNGEWKIVDLYEDLPISVVIQETDVTDFQGRKSPYSKQFSVPGTNNNNRVFEEYFEVNGIDFDPLTKISSVVQYRGTDIFNGTLRLEAQTKLIIQKIAENNNKLIETENQALEDNVSFWESFGNTFLSLGNGIQAQVKDAQTGLDNQQKTTGKITAENEKWYNSLKKVFE